MELPRTIQAFFNADRTNDREALVRCFAADAVVHDEGHFYAGQNAIGSWWDGSKARYRHVAEPLEASSSDHGMNVRARVTGEFPGSPATLTFGFSFTGNQIATLEIGA